jgi:protein-S-isoprenylcysteine O-methyltransferase Ste14
MGGMPAYAYIILLVGWILWFLPFIITGWNRNSPQKSDSRARWGIILQGLAYAIVWQGHFWTRSPSTLRVALSILFLVLAALLSFTSTRALGRHLRLDAALSSDHKLVRSGPYRMLRHPIYTSMFCLVLGTGFMIAYPLLFSAAIVVFLIGTEIRVHVEDKLLASRFGDEFSNYHQAVHAYIPLIR